MVGEPLWNAREMAAFMNANKFDGYCTTAGSIVAHTDDGDFVGTLDRGQGNWSDSTKLVFVRGK